MTGLVLSLPIADPVALFGVVMLVVAVAPLLAARLRLPGTMGLILGGALVGESAFGLIQRDAVMVLLGTIGLLYLLFTAGLTLDIDQFLKLKYRSLVFGLLAFILPGALGIVAGKYLLDLTWAGALMVGAVVGTHTLVAYPIARRLGVASRQVAVMAVGGTVVCDALGLILLAAVVKGASGDIGLLFWAQFLGVVICYLIVVLLGVPRLGRWFFRAFPNDPNAEMAFVIATLFVMSATTEAIGLAPIIGAFLTGLALNPLIPPGGPLMSRIVFVGDALFVPFFLVSVGLLVDFRVIVSSVSVWMILTVFMAVLAAGKFAAAAIAIKLYGHTGAERRLLFGLTIPQAAATLAVTLIGFEQLEVFSIEVVNAVVLLILASCLAGSALVESAGRALADESASEATGLGVAEQRLLVALAKPENAAPLMNLALALRKPKSAEPLHALTVLSSNASDRASVVRAEKTLQEAVAIPTAASVPAFPTTRIDDNPADGIARAVKELRATEVLIGWHPRTSPTELVLGGLQDRLVDATSELMIVASLHSPLGTTTSVHLLLPGRCHLLRGFEETAHLIGALAQNLKAGVQIFGNEPEINAAKRLLVASGVSSPVRGLLVERFDIENPARMMSLSPPKETDLIVLVVPRRHTVAYHRAHRSLPAHLAQQFPANNFLAIHPAEDQTILEFEAGRRGLPPLTQPHSEHVSNLT